MSARGWRWVAIIPLVALGATALNGGTHDWFQATSSIQRMQVAGQFVFGVGALLAAIALAMRSPLAARFFRIFAVGAVVAAALAPVAWADSPWWQGAFALAGAALVVWLLWLPFRRGCVPPPSA